MPHWYPNSTAWRITDYNSTFSPFTSCLQTWKEPIKWKSCAWTEYMYQPLEYSCPSRTFVYDSAREWWLFCFCLQIVNFTKPAMIPPQSTVTPFFVQFLANGSDMAFSTILRVYTNASIFTVPIHCFDGKLKVSSAWCIQELPTSTKCPSKPL